MHESLVHALLSSQVTEAPDTHEPPEQASPDVHASLSLHALVLLAFAQPDPLSQESVVHAFASLQSTADPDWHEPLAQTSPEVHALLSLQTSVLLAFTQPLPASQESLVQPLLSSQSTADPGWHAPPAQRSPLVHALPSLQDAALFANTHPDPLSQESLVQPLLSLQVSAAPG